MKRTFIGIVLLILIISCVENHGIEKRGNSSSSIMVLDSISLPDYRSLLLKSVNDSCVEIGGELNGINTQILIEKTSNFKVGLKEIWKDFLLEVSNNTDDILVLNGFSTDELYYYEFKLSLENESRYLSGVLTSRINLSFLQENFTLNSRLQNLDFLENVLIGKNHLISKENSMYLDSLIRN